MNGHQVIVVLITAGQTVWVSPSSRHTRAAGVVPKDALTLIRLVSDLETFASICGDCADPIVSFVRFRVVDGVDWVSVENDVVSLTYWMSAMHFHSTTVNLPMPMRTWVTL
jgi:hypothetical protein